MILVILPRNPAFGTAFAPENRQPFDMIKLMLCTSLHQFSLCIHKGKRGMGEKAYYMHKPKLVQSGATD